MDPNQKLERQFQDYQNLAKENKNIDVASLMLNAIQNQNQNVVSSKTKKWAYLISVGLPPFGLLFALKFYFSEEDDAKNVAYMCIVLTIVSVLLFYFLMKVVLSGSGTSLQQIQQIKPSDIQQLTQ